MADYDFYVNVYLGNQIQEKAFASLAAQAAGVLDQLQRTCRVTGGEEARAMAVCAMAECLQNHARRCRGITAASVGQASVRYESGGVPLQRQLYEKAAVYLDIYRGVG